MVVEEERGCRRSGAFLNLEDGEEKVVSVAKVERRRGRGMVERRLTQLMFACCNLHVEAK